MFVRRMVMADDIVEKDYRETEQEVLLELKTKSMEKLKKLREQNKRKKIEQM